MRDTPRPTTIKRQKTTPANPQRSAERCDPPVGATRPDALAPAKTGHHFAESGNAMRRQHGFGDILGDIM